jgi:hypothetical protein
MPEGAVDRGQKLEALSQAIADAAAFFEEVDEELWDGHMTARAILSHLVFWHREYVTIAQALVERRPIPLKKGTFAELNAISIAEFEDQSMQALARCLRALQGELLIPLRRLPDWDVNFPVKQGVRRKSAANRIAAIEFHVRNHVNRLRRAERHGEAWVRAYYMEPT